MKFTDDLAYDWLENFSKFRWLKFYHFGDFVNLNHQNFLNESNTSFIIEYATDDIIHVNASRLFDDQQAIYHHLQEHKKITFFL